MIKNTRPFLKWAGGKYSLLERLKPFISSLKQESTGYFIEPFVGAGAVGLNAAGRVVVNDCNLDLINTWRMLQSNPDSFIKKCQLFFSKNTNNAESYYLIRDEFNNKKGTALDRAVMFLYLNKHCFNGLCRYNASGQFNVPFGKYKKIELDLNGLETVSAKIQNWIIFNLDFRCVIKMAGENDIVYCDPPYVSSNEVKNGFTLYSTGGFSSVEHEALATEAKLATERGATVLISNHDTAYTRNLYTDNGAVIHTFNVQHNINCRGNNRKKTAELLAVFNPHN